ncbi:hypothetical protein FO014_00450 [Serratia rhizosphaerae]|uniref:Uncharacterized protein n=1 Tax=Serratia rhizosphaerae TaxID=2597702 RepID=A0ABX6GH03_9GAMM|nr:hypothetical protein FO014_00450 [Serratia rhizosphaerae]
MNSVRNFSSIPQLRCRPVSGGRSAAAFSYELNVQGRWQGINHTVARNLWETLGFLAQGGRDGKRTDRAV